MVTRITSGEVLCGAAVPAATPAKSKRPALRRRPDFFGKRSLLRKVTLSDSQSAAGVLPAHVRAWHSGFAPARRKRWPGTYEPARILDPALWPGADRAGPPRHSPAFHRAGPAAS